MSFTPTMNDYAFPWTHLATPVPKEAWPRKLRRTLAAVDFVVISAVVTATFYLLFEPEDHLSGIAAHVPYLVLAPILVVAWTALLGVLGTRDRRVMGAGLKEYRQVIWSGFILFGFLAISSYIVQGSLSRGLFITALPLGTLSLLLARWATRQALNRLRAQGRAMTPTLIVGSAAQVTDLLGNLARRTDVGYQASGVCVVGAGKLEGELGEVTRHGSESLVSAATSGRYQAVIITDGLERSAIRELAWRLENRPIELMFLPQLTDIAGPRVSVSDVEGLSLVHVDLPQFTGWKLWVKRAFDIVFATLALIVLSPVFLVVAILIKLDDGGPVIFRQERIGLRGKPFVIHKFRTMELDAEAKIADLIANNGGKALLFKLADDPRITGIGKVLRKYSIDELPQFWTVLRGGMSVVGPRPQVAREVAEYSTTHHRRLLIKPGVTGLWQVNGRSELSLDESVRLDLRYVENWSLISDIVIVAKTVGVVLRPGGAY